LNAERPRVLTRCVARACGGENARGAKTSFTRDEHGSENRHKSLIVNELARLPGFTHHVTVRGALYNQNAS